jgi:hypothetical protein
MATTSARQRESMNGRMKEANMMTAHALAISAVGLVLLTHGIEGQGLAQYRNFELRSDLAAVSTQTGIASSEAKTIHQRPALMQDLEWRPSRWVSGSTAASTDPVDQILFSFYNNQLFRIVVDYGHDRTEGMTDADMMEAISALYGAPVKRVPGTVRIASRVEIESGSPVARWGDATHAVVLYRTSSYRETFRLIVTEPALSDLARKADTEAARLDAQEAPSREIARDKKERDDRSVAAEKARAANKDVFRP